MASIRARVRIELNTN